MVALCIISPGTLLFDTTSTSDPQCCRMHYRLFSSQVRFFAAELVAALAHLHSLDIVYRDLKVRQAGMWCAGVWVDGWSTCHGSMQRTR